MARMWPVALVLVMASCSSGPPPLQTGMQPPQGYPMGGPGMDGGLGGPGLFGGGLDPSLMAPLGSGAGGGMGILGGMGMDGGGGLGAGLLGGPGMAGGPGFGFGGMGGGLPLGTAAGPGGATLFDRPLPGMLGEAAAPDGALEAAVPSASDVSTTAAPAPVPVPDLRAPSDHGAILISTRMRTDPGDLRIQTSPTDSGTDVTLAIPMTGEVEVAAAGRTGHRTHLVLGGVATTRLRLERVQENQWRPTGIGVMTSLSDEEPPFRLTRLTIVPAGGRSWTITDATAIAPLDQLPNIPAGTRVTVTATVSGDTSQAMPFLVANGKLLHLNPLAQSPATADVAETRTFTRTFTLAPLTLTKDRLTLRKEAGMIGVKVLHLAALAATAHPPVKVQATGWAVCFPSQDSGREAGFAELPNAARLNRHVQAILEIIQAADNRGRLLIAEQPVRHPVTVE